MNILQRSFKKKIEFNEPLTISIFSNQKVVFAAQSIEEMSRKKIKYKFNFILNIFFFLEKQNEIILPQFHKLFNIYSYTNLQNINTQFTDFFYNLNKIRVQTASLKLICFNKTIQLCDVANSQWQIQQDSLVRNLYMLNNHTKYIQKLYFNSLNNQKIYFEVQFQLNLIQNKKYKMTKKFYVNIEKNCSNLTKISQTHHYRKSYDRKLFSQIVKQNGLSIKQIQKEFQYDKNFLN